MRLGILNMRHLIIGQVGIKIVTSIMGLGIKLIVDNIPQQRWKGQLCKQNNLDKSSNFPVNAKHAIEEQSEIIKLF